MPKKGKKMLLSDFNGPEANQSFLPTGPSGLDRFSRGDRFGDHRGGSSRFGDDEGRSEGNWRGSSRGSRFGSTSRARMNPPLPPSCAYLSFSPCARARARVCVCFTDVASVKSRHHHYAVMMTTIDLHTRNFHICWTRSSGTPWYSWWKA